MNDIEPTGFHDIPKEVLHLLKDDALLREKWNNLTALGRNEWVCWITNAKLIETQTKRRKRFVEEITAGKRRPCCWPGCMHREHNKK